MMEYQSESKDSRAQERRKNLSREFGVYLATAAAVAVFYAEGSYIKNQLSTKRIIKPVTIEQIIESPKSLTMESLLTAFAIGALGLSKCRR